MTYVNLTKKLVFWYSHCLNNVKNNYYSMKKITKELEQINSTFEYGRSLGIVRAVAKNDDYDGRSLMLSGKETVFFGNCSYMGLDQNEEIKEAAKNAIDKYGMYFSSSRTFVGLELFEQMEEKLEEMFEKPVNNR